MSFSPDFAQTVAEQLGMQAFPVVGKYPLSGYRWLVQSRQTPGIQTRDSDLWAQATGYALMPLEGDSLCAVDIDSAAFQRRLYSLLPVLRNTFTISSGRDGHCNLIVRLQDTAHLQRRLQCRQGKREVASLRNFGSYIIGPGSIHPDTGAAYQSGSSNMVIALDETQTRLLLSLFEAANPSEAIKTHLPAPDGLDEVIAHLQAAGYRQNGDWLNGPCIHADRHANGDRHASFGININSGVGHCFLCGSFSPREVAEALGKPLQLRLLPQKSPFTPKFREAVSIAPPTSDTVQIELHLTTELLRRGKYQSARYFNLLWDASRQAHGQHTYAFSELLELGKLHRMSKDQVKKSISQMVAIGLLIRTDIGVYCRIGLDAARQLLGLGKAFIAATLPREALMSKPAQFCRNVLAVVEQRLPPGLATATIASSTGVSRRTVYNHENEVGIERLTQTERVGTVPTAAPDFVKVYDNQQAYVAAFKDVYDAIEVAARSGGQAWGWKQRPSVRFFKSAENAHVYIERPF